MKIAAIQMNSAHDKAKNLKDAARLINAVMDDESPDIILLPEMFTYLGDSKEKRIQAAERLSPDGKIIGEAYCLMQTMAQENQVVIHAGSICELEDGKHYNTSIVFNRDGSELGRYRKIHLLEIEVDEGLIYKESSFYQHGENIFSYDVNDTKEQTPHTIGATICFDLRFPELYRQLANLGCEVIMVPSAFFKMTGKDHWETLCRARAIETQCYVVAAAQTGSVPGSTYNREYWGHSMIVDPWGKVIAEAGTGVGYICANIDLKHLRNIRKHLPLLQCQREFN